MKTFLSLLGTALFAVFFSLSAQSAQIPLEAALPLDPSITVKKLPNGLQYYIRENQKPENRAMFRLVVNAGSLQETEAQKGLAHFLEHMAFNGTENFEKQELVNFLERIGMRFGADLNAYTSFDETVYMLEVPMDDEEVLKTAFRVLRDWMNGISFDSEEIEKERGVVIEEWRLRRGAQGRLSDKQIPILFHESRYASRLPIGEVEIIQNAPREEFVDFYKKWYRPNLMAIIAVGDFESEKIEALIKSTFSDVKNPVDAPERVSYPVPDHEETLFSIETDPELQYTQLQIAYKRPPSPQGTAAAYRASIVESLYTAMLNQRLSERVQEANPPYLYGAMGKASMVRSKEVIIQTAVVKEGQFDEGLKALLLEAKRAQRDGFTPSELSRIKADVLRSMEQAYAEREKTNSSSYTGEYTRNFLEQEPIPGIAMELELYQTFVPEISLEEINQAAANWITPNNRVVLFSAPEKEGLDVPSKEAILEVIKSVDQLEIAAYDDGNLDAPLIANAPQKGSVVTEGRIEDLDVTEWTLSNGVRVLIKSTDFKNDQILMRSFSPGGNSQVSNDDYESASMAINIVARSGLGDFDLIQLGKKLSGKIASASPSISERFESLNGASSPQDLETMLQLANLYFTQPRADAKTFHSILAQLKVVADNRLNDPQSVFSDAIERAFYGDHPRHQPLNHEYLGRIDPEKAFQIYQSRFADASDFTFAFVGNVDLEALKPLVETYLGSLPKLDRSEQGKDVGDEKAKGQVKITVNKGLEEKATVRVTFHGEAEWTPEQRFALQSTVDILKIRLREVLREDKGGVYGVGVYGGLSRWPSGYFSNNISFGCEPGKVDELIAAALAEIEKLKIEGPSDDNLGKIKEAHLRSYEKGLKENSFWVGNLINSIQNDLDPSRILSYPERVEALSKETIQNAAKKYFDQTNLFTAILLPEEKKGE
jgi:zinc protease